MSYIAHWKSPWQRGLLCHCVSLAPHANLWILPCVSSYNLALIIAHFIIIKATHPWHYSNKGLKVHYLHVYKTEKLFICQSVCLSVHPSVMLIAVLQLLTSTCPPPDTINPSSSYFKFSLWVNSVHAALLLSLAYSYTSYTNRYGICILQCLCKYSMIMYVTFTSGNDTNCWLLSLLNNPCT